MMWRSGDSPGAEVPNPYLEPAGGAGVDVEAAGAGPDSVFEVPESDFEVSLFVSDFGSLVLTELPFA